MKNYISLHEAATRLPVPVAKSTLWRWCTKGFYIPAAKHIVRMQHVNIGRKMFTTEQWVEQFIDDLTAVKALQREAKGKKPGKLERPLELYEADAILRRAGI